jgi:NitT/TauT family transport system substrate-binding protein
MVSAFVTPDVTAVVTWNPLLSEIDNISGANLVFDSSKIPGEIIDIMMVNTTTLKDNPDFGKALVGAWYEMMGLMSKDDEAGKKARSAMGAASGTDLAGFDAQLKTTQMFYAPAEAVKFNKEEKLVATQKFVAQFLFDHGILGEGAASPEAVGMEFPGGKTLGDTANIKLRFDPTYMEMAAEGKL